MEYQEIKAIPKTKDSLSALAPYIGKMRPELAGYLIDKYAYGSNYVFDPFSGSGSILLEGWKRGYNVIGNDLNYYAYVLSLAKMHPYEKEADALKIIDQYSKKVERYADNFDISIVPDWICEFFDENTLKEICCWTYYLRKNKEWFF